MATQAIAVLKQQRHDGIRRFVVQSTSDARRHYVVTRNRRGSWRCSCLGNSIARKQPDGTLRRIVCRHIKGLK